MNHKRPNEFICQNVCEVEAFLGEVKYKHVRTTPDVNDLDNFKDFHFFPNILHLSLFTCTLHIGVNSTAGFQSSNLH